MAALAAALLLAGCGADGQVVVGPDDSAAPVVFPAAVTYAYEPDTRLSYRMELNGTDWTRDASDGVPENSDIELGLPDGELEIKTSAVIDQTYRIGPGPDDKTLEIYIASDLTELSVTGDEDLDETLFGSPSSALDQIPPATVVVDEQGKVLEFAFSEAEASYESAEQALFGLIQEQILSTYMPGANFDGPLGPVFPTDQLLAVGSVWTDKTESRIGDQTIATDYTHEITGVDELNGAEVVVIESTVTVGGFEIDLEDLVGSVMGSAWADLDDPAGGRTFDEAELEAEAELIASAMAGTSLAFGPTTAETTAQMSYERVADGLISGFVQQSVTRMSGTLTAEVDLSGHYDSAPDLIVRTITEFDYEVRFTLVGDDRL